MPLITELTLRYQTQEADVDHTLDVDASMDNASFWAQANDSSGRLGLSQTAMPQDS